MKVLVTGSAGFIAGHVIDRLHAEGHTALLLDRRTRVTDLTPGDEHIVGDVQDAGVVSEAIAYADAVLHVAGVLGTAETIDNPLPAIQTNILGGLNVFQGVRQHKKRCAYITVGNFFMDSTYSITKTTAERFAWMFNAEHGTEIAVIRALNAYGPRQKSKPVRKIMPNFVREALAGDPITIYGDGTQIMDMVPVEFVADVLVRAITVDHGQYRYTPTRATYADNPMRFDCGSGQWTAVNQIAASVLKASGRYSGLREGQDVRHVPMRAGEPEGAVVMGDPSTLAPLFGDTVPEIESLAEALPRTIDWYREHPDA